VTLPELFLVWPALVLFAAAFVAELFGLVFRRASLRRPAFAASIAAFALVTGGAVSRWIALGHGPVMRTYENSLAASWFLFAVFLGVAWKAPRMRALLVGVLPAIVLMIGNGVMSSPEREPLLPPYQSGWLWIHVGFAWLSYASFVVAAVQAALYLVKRRRADRVAPGAGAADAARDDILPAAPELDELALRTILFGFVCHTVMVGAGAIWAHGLWGRYWAWDPVETWSLISWIVYGLYLHLRLTYGWRGRRAAWLAIAAAVAVLITFGGMGFTGGIHTRLL
jgi:cytochrome c-type biogenesis protein CcsB